MEHITGEDLINFIKANDAEKLPIVIIDADTSWPLLVDLLDLFIDEDGINIKTEYSNRKK